MAVHLDIQSACGYTGNMKTDIQKIYSYSVFYEAASEGGYVAFVPSLPGCHTQGETLEEAEANSKEAIGVYLESVSMNPHIC